MDAILIYGSSPSTDASPHTDASPITESKSKKRQISPPEKLSAKKSKDVSSAISPFIMESPDRNGFRINTTESNSGSDFWKLTFESIETNQKPGANQKPGTNQKLRSNKKPPPFPTLKDIKYSI